MFVVHGVGAPNHSIAYEEQQHMSIYAKYPAGYYVYYYLRQTTSSRAAAGTPYYVGKGYGMRAWKYHTHTVRVPKDKSLILIISEGLTEEQAFKIESLHIKLWGRIDLSTGILHNKTNGGDGASGTIRSQETRDKIRQTLKSRPGRKHSEHTKQLIAERNRQRVIDPELKARMTVGLAKGRGRKSEETKRKISEAHKGVPLSDDHRESLKKAWATRDRTPHNKGKTSPRISCIHCRVCVSTCHLTTHQKYHCENIIEKTKTKSRNFWHTEESKLKISMAKKGSRHSEETKNLIGEKGKGRTPHNKGVTEERIICSICDRGIAKSHYDRHTSNCTSTKDQCRHCLRFFTKKYTSQHEKKCKLRSPET